MSKDSGPRALIRNHVNVGKAVRRFTSGNRDPQNGGGKNSSPCAKCARCHWLRTFWATRQHIRRRVRARSTSTARKFDRRSKHHPWPRIQCMEIHVIHGHSRDAPPGCLSGLKDAASAAKNTKRAYGFNCSMRGRLVLEVGKMPCERDFRAGAQAVLP